VNAEPSTRPVGARLSRLSRASRLAALAGAALFAMAGCAAGQIAETAKQHPTVGGVYANIGDVALRNLSIEAPDGPSWPAGSDVSLYMSIVNNERTPETLTGITVQGAASAIIFGNSTEYLRYLAQHSSAAPATTPASGSAQTPSSAATTSAGATVTPSGTGANAGPTTVTASTSATATAPTPTLTPSSPAAAAPGAAGSVVIPAGLAVRFGYAQGSVDGPIVLLTQIGAPLGGGESLKVTFTFLNAGSITVDVPVDLSVNGASDAPTINVHGGSTDSGLGH
jgi:copper(I)-binding protein